MSGHHVYLSAWTPTIGEVLVVLVVKKERKNEHDQHAVAVIRDGAIIGHASQAITRTSFSLTMMAMLAFVK